MEDLKLLAFDAEDLGVVSAHLQDAVMTVADMAFLPKENRFAVIANRFDWLKAGNAANPADKESHERRRSALRFERVLSAQVMGVDPQARRDVLSLLAIRFEETDPPGGHVTLHFSGGAAIRLKVECIEAELRDLGGVWRAKSKPTHPSE